MLRFRLNTYYRHPPPTNRQEVPIFGFYRESGTEGVNTIHFFVKADKKCSDSAFLGSKARRRTKRTSHKLCRSEKAEEECLSSACTSFSNHAHNSGIHFAHRITQLINISLIMACKEDGLSACFQTLDELAHFLYAVLVEAVQRLIEN